MLQNSNDEIRVCFWQRSLQIHKLDSFRIKLFKVGIYLNCLSLNGIRAFPLWTTAPRTVVPMKFLPGHLPPFCSPDNYP